MTLTAAQRSEIQRASYAKAVRDDRPCTKCGRTFSPATPASKFCGPICRPTSTDYSRRFRARKVAT